MTTRKERFYSSKRRKKAFNINKTKSNREKELNKLIRKLKIKLIDNPIKNSIELYIKTKNLNKECDYDYFIKHKNFTQRVFLNNIRHNYSNYMELVTKVINMSEYERKQFKEKVNKEIIRKYKDLI